jgi:hypothetical protein
LSSSTVSLDVASLAEASAGASGNQTATTSGNTIVKWNTIMVAIPPGVAATAGPLRNIVQMTKINPALLE